MIPSLDYVWDFLFGTSADVNMSRMVDFYEKNRHLETEVSANPWLLKNS
jgi:hypothetical protein